MATVFDRVKRIIAKQLDIEEEEIKLESSFKDDFDADSLEIVELVMALEEEFGSGGEPIEIPDEDAEKITTVKEVVEYLKDNGLEDE